jgi:hypothetical protein
VEFGDLRLRFTESGRSGKSLGHGFAAHLTQDTDLRVVPGIVGLGAMTVRLTAAMNDGRNGTRAQITQVLELLENLGSLGFQKS